ncbi:MAG: GNAT family N-acetyltransferase [Crenarchaeota archaeon]|nr:GNAT family N-acetyltransferase [Thermoproteota archaeon]MDA1124905.1 GNAT family N-acetyltransferase [Thermoproteota archaeon]
MDIINLLKLDFNDEDFSHIRTIRKSVFNTELGISENELFDKHDETCDHFLIFDGKNIVGSVRIISMDHIVKLERMAIVKNFRVKNYGKNCISQIKDYYSSKGFSQIILDSIYSVRGFYKKCGFVEEGDIFQRVGIEHIRMSLTF